MPSLPTLGQKPWAQQLNDYLLVGHDASGNNLQAAPDATKVDKDSVVVAATRIVANKLLAGDTQPAFRILGDGTLGWGPGGTGGLDANLYRSASLELSTNSNFKLTGGSFYSGSGYVFLGSGADAWIYRVAGNIVGTIGSFRQQGARGGWGFVGVVDSDAQPTTYLRNDGYLWFGAGGSTLLDTNIYRSAADTLKTDDNFQVQGPNFQGAWHAANGNWCFTTYSGGAYLNTDEGLRMTSIGGTGYTILSGKRLADTQPRFAILDGVPGGGAGAQIQWGPGGSTAPDVVLYRGWNDGLMSNAEFRLSRPGTGYGAFSTAISGNVWWSLNTDGRMSWGPGNTTFDTNLYRLGPGLATGHRLAVNYDQAGTTQVLVGQYGGSLPYAALTLGNDTYLYRAGVGTLKTDGGWQAVGEAYMSYGTLTGGVAGWAFHSQGNGDVEAWRLVSMDRNVAGIVNGLALRNSAGGASQAGSGVEIRMGSADTYYAAIKSVYEVPSPLYLIPSLRSYTMNGSYLAGSELERLRIASDGTLWINPSAGLDTALYRYGAGIMRTNGSFAGDNGFIADYGNSNSRWNGLRFGADQGVSLYRPRAGWLGTDGVFTTGSPLPVAAISGTTIVIGASYAGSSEAGYGIVATTGATDYIKSAFKQKSDASGYFRTVVEHGTTERFGWIDNATPSFQIQGTLTFGTANGVTGDVNLYRNMADSLVTDDRLTVRDLIIDPNLAGYKLWFGNAQDTNLYRRSANVLSTDDTFYIGNGQTLVLDNGSGNLQIEMGWNGRNYRHSIKTGHDGSGTATNWMDFYIWSNADNMANLGSKRVLRLQGDGQAMFANNVDISGNFQSALVARQKPGGGIVLASNYVGDSVDRFNLNGDGGHNWGPGNAGIDVSLYRMSAGNLRCSGTLWSYQFACEQTIYSQYNVGIILSNNGPNSIRLYGILNAGGSYYCADWNTGIRVDIDGVQYRIPCQYIG